jgi:molybdopterin molybdotransferase
MLDRARPLPAAPVALREALGLTLAADVLPLDDQPPFDNSAMDGYAVRAADVAGAAREQPIALTVVETIPAGSWPARIIGAGQAAKIMTGAPLPEGADAVVRVEDTDTAAPQVRLFHEPALGENIRRRGEDLRRGQPALRAGQRLTPARVGLCAAAGCAAVFVHRRPRIGVVVTGEELVEPGEPLPPGKIRNSNSYALHAQILETGGEPVHYGIAPDERRATAALLRRALGECDIVLTSGGVSAGDFDVVKDALADAGGAIFFTRVAQRPGAPLVGGAAGETLFYGLPGNPVSVMVCFEMYVRPAIRRLLGRQNLWRPRLTGCFEEPFRKPAGLTFWARVIVRRDGDRVALTPSAPQGSGVLRSMALGDGLAELPPEMTVAGPGDPLTVHLFDNDD